MNLQELIKAKQKSIGMTDTLLAKKAGIHRNTLASIKNNIDSVSYGNVMKVCNVLNLSYKIQSNDIEVIQKDYDEQETKDVFEMMGKVFRPDNMVHRFRCPVCNALSNEKECIHCGCEMDLI